MEKALRDKLIDALIEGEVECNGGADNWFLKDLLRTGCAGYENMSDDDLIAACQAVGIDPTTGESLVDEEKTK